MPSSDIIEKNVSAQQCADFIAEADVLHALVADRSDEDFLQVTPFHKWRVYDVLLHLRFIDWFAHLAITEPDVFAAELKAMAEWRSAGATATGGDQEIFDRLTGYENHRLAPVRPHALLDAWREGRERLSAAFAAQEAERKIAWFGPPIKAATLLAARQMEVWGYGQDIFDHFCVERRNEDRLKTVAEFAVKTFRFAFANRGLDLPAQAPFLRLTAPSGALWSFNDPAAENRIEGSAADFCLVAVQRRNVADTKLRVTGVTAATWMTIAQCIAGPAVSGPLPGERV